MNVLQTLTITSIGFVLFAVLWVTKVEESLAVSDLTRRTAKVDEIQVIKEFYEDHLSSDPSVPLVE